MVFEPSKSSWHKPELVILVRSEPEEAVLTHCKVQALELIGAVRRAEVHGCSIEGGSCAACQARPPKS